MGYEKGNSVFMQKPTDSHVKFMIRGYCLEELLGYGKLTSLYRARTEELWQMPEVIMTLLHIPEAFSTQARKRFLERFLHEANKVVQLRHPSLFPLYGYGEEDGLPYLVMPDVTGQTLAERLKKKKRWRPSEALALLEPIAAALSYIHNQGLVYQFFSPANVLFQKDAPPQITGLNLSQILCLAGLEEEKINTSSFEHLKNLVGGYLGAPEYLAPEVVRGTEPDPRSDVYSLGIILFEMLSGQPPFTGKDYLEIAHKHIQTLLPSLNGIAPELPMALELVVNRALHRNLNYRFQTPSELIATFSHVLEERIYRVKHVPLLAEGEQIRALLTSPTSKAPKNDQQLGTNLKTASPAHAQENSSEQKWSTSNGRMIPPAVTLPSYSVKTNRLADDPIAPGLHKKPLRSARGFLMSEQKNDPKPPLSSLARSPQKSDNQPNMDEESEVPAQNTDMMAMAQELHLMMRKLQASLTK
jgi:serine/threonine-protein kinase